MSRRTVRARELGTVFNPHIVREGYRVRFEYDKGGAFEVTLEANGTLAVRTSGHFSDLLATHHHVANHCIVVARRWSEKEMRHVEFIKPERRTV